MNAALRPILPTPELDAQGEAMCREFELLGGGSLAPEQWRQATLVFAFSPYCAQICLRAPALLNALIGSGELGRAREWSALATQLRAEAEAQPSKEAFYARLRQLRERELLRIAWRDLCALADLDETLRDLSRFAQLAIDAALIWCYATLAAVHGRPRDAAGLEQRLVVLGMGKLGGEELNFSSDVDLMFAYAEEGSTDGARSLGNQEFFVRLGQMVIQCLNDITADGYVFRVDMRLRPFGEAGALAASFAALEDYYQTHGRDWERYALIKARPVAGDVAVGNALLKRLQPFVYRRYLDFGALAALREMKALINTEVARKGLGDNVKLGPGGIREIEFIGQAFQLIRGGQQPRYRKRGIREVLRLLAEEADLSMDASEELRAAYAFLRLCENRLQMEADKQTHRLPTEPVSRARLAGAMGYAGWEDFLHALAEHRRRVRSHFDAVFGSAEGLAPAQAGKLDSLWRGLLADAAASKLLQGLGYACGEDILRDLRALRASRSYLNLSARGQERMDRLMPQMLEAAAQTPEPCVTFPRLLRFVETVARRSVYLSLLAERPQALKQLAVLACASAWIADHLCRYPLLLDELLDARVLYAPQDRRMLSRQLEAEMGEVDAADLETVMERLRRFRHAEVLKVAAADIMQVLPLMKVSDHLTWIAEAVLEVSLRHAWAELTARHGRPLYRLDDGQHEAGFAIIAYGKLGGIELGYGSDLDLVFLHDSRGSAQQTEGPRVLESPVFFARLAQRVVHLISTYTPAGVAYAIDARLRPNGNAGALVSGLDVFERYQNTEAWTWEHQALIRARWVAGSTTIAGAFADIRRSVLCKRREPLLLQQEVREMRARMRAQLGSKQAGRFALKQDAGGIADIEFMMQYEVLAHAHDRPELAVFTDIIRILESLKANDLLPVAEAEFLAEAYLAFRGKVHRLTLGQQPAVVPEGEFAEQRQGVQQLWRKIIGE